VGGSDPAELLAHRRSALGNSRGGRTVPIFSSAIKLNRIPTKKTDPAGLRGRDGVQVTSGLGGNHAVTRCSNVETGLMVPPSPRRAPEIFPTAAAIAPTLGKFARGALSARRMCEDHRRGHDDRPSHRAQSSRPVIARAVASEKGLDSRRRLCSIYVPKMEAWEAALSFSNQALGRPRQARSREPWIASEPGEGLGSKEAARPAAEAGGDAAGTRCGSS
jgi:hypothetical protein